MAGPRPSPRRARAGGYVASTCESCVRVRAGEPVWFDLGATRVVHGPARVVPNVDDRYDEKSGTENDNQNDSKNDNENANRSDLETA